MTVLGTSPYICPMGKVPPSPRPQSPSFHLRYPTPSHATIPPATGNPPTPGWCYLLLAQAGCMAQMGADGAMEHWRGPPPLFASLLPSSTGKGRGVWRPRSHLAAPSPPTSSLPAYSPIPVEARAASDNRDDLRVARPGPMERPALPCSADGGAVSPADRRASEGLHHHGRYGAGTALACDGREGGRNGVWVLSTVLLYALELPSNVGTYLQPRLAPLFARLCVF